MENKNIDNRVFYLPGDLVTIKKDMPNKPVMIVVKKVTKYLVQQNADYFQGILCRWFTSSGELQEAIWNTKDLIKLNN